MKFKKLAGRTKDLHTFLQKFYFVSKTLSRLYRHDEDYRPTIEGFKYYHNKSIFTVKIPPGYCFEELEDKVKYFETATGNRCLMDRKGKVFTLTVYHQDLQPVIPYRFKPEELKQYKLPFYIGIDLNGEIFAGDFLEVYHLLFAGNTGNGKTNFIRTLITTLFLSDQKFMLNVIDFKGGGDFAFCKDKKINLVTVPGTEAHLFEGLDQEINKRQSLRTRYQKENIFQLPEGLRPPAIITIIDEIHELGEKRSQEIVNRIVRLGRSEGIFLVVCTQRPSAEVFPKFTETRSQLRGRLCMSVTVKEDSLMVLQNTKATQLQTVGRGIYQFLGKDTEIQTFFLPSDQARKLIKEKECIKFEYQSPKRLQ